jgi:outer membrane protein TolC
MASWTPFSGLGELSAARASAANAAAATARAEGAAAAAALDQEARDADVQVATARLAIAEDAVAQGAEAHRIVARKYDGGLATVTELLDAAAAETATRLALAEASYQTIVAVAARFVAHGQTVAPMTALEN